MSFAGEGRILCQLTNNASMASGCVGKIGAEGGTSISAGIQTGMRVMVTGRRDLVPADEDVKEVMLVLSDGVDDAGCEPVVQVADQVKAAGILVVAVCIGLDCDRECLLAAASSPRYWYPVDVASDLARAFDDITALLLQVRSEAQRVVISALTIVDRLPPNMAYVPDSAVPPPNTIDPTSSELVWRFAHVPAEGVTITLRALPLEVGVHATNAGATAAFTDSKGLTGAFAFDDPIVNVVWPPTALPTPSATPVLTAMPTPSPTPAPTSVETPTSAPSPQPTASPATEPLYFPRVLANGMP